MHLLDEYRCRRTEAACLGILSVGLLFGCPLASNAGETFTQQPTVAASQVRDVVETRPEAPATDGASLDQGPKPLWIWGPDANRQYVVTKEFDGGSKSARLKASCDNRVTLFVNGKRVASSDEWNSPVDVDIQKHLQPGKNLLRAEVANAGGPAAFVCKLALTMPDGAVRYVVSDETWNAAEKSKPDQQVALKTFGKMGVQPWGDVFSQPVGLAAKDRDVFNVPEGFQVELLYTVPKETLGSWVNITTDPKGRLIVSDQGNLGLCRITPPAIGSNDETKVESLDVKIDGKMVSGAHGLLWAFDSLYVVCNGGPGSGLYRCQDTDGDDQFDKVEKLRDIPGGGEHGPHAIRLSPDGKSLFIAAGNHTHMPFEIKTNAPPQTMGGQRTEQLRATLPEGVTSRLMPNWDEDLLLPRQWDGGGHAAGVLAPGGWICKIDPDGKNWEVFSNGYRNEFDFAFNADGEMFAYDADMEWDFGSPWYRPTRVVHATSGSEFGWRSGTGKWPSYYIDSLPELINIGPGSPVGVEFGYGTKFPAKYQQALYLCDWTFGTMYAIHIEPSGSSYTATKEEFVSRTPLPLTDCTVGQDGALYFTIGGRGAQSELYRVTYVGKEDTSPVVAADGPSRRDNGLVPTSPRRLRELRHQIEAYHVGTHNYSTAVPFLVPQLSSSDRQIGYAARVALERIWEDCWQNEILGVDNATNHSAERTIQGCVALARQAEPELLPQILAALGTLDFAKLSDTQQLGLLRAYQLVFIRLGNPIDGDDITSAALTKKFDDLFPQKSDFVNRELAILMIHFQSPDAAKKLVPLLTRERVASQESIGELLTRNSGYGGTIAAMLANQPDQQQYHYAFNLRNLKTGWTLDQRKTYFAWFDKARQWSGGASYPKFLTNIDNDAFANCTDIERLAVEASGVRKPYVAPALPKPAGPGKEYAVGDVIALATDKLKGRNFKNGEKMYKAARCVVCHRFGGDGGATGPDLTQLAGRFNLKDLTDAIVDPSKVISDQFKASIIATTDGKVITGQLVSETKDSVTLLIDPENATKVVEIKKTDIEASQPSSVSLMPKDLLKSLNEREVLDLLAYLLSRGNPGDAMFGE
ncbi:MAG: c-type cytochrome [Planctomycetota bacterium]|nr:c-type cytochrome [Planctomycetota bacterium]